MSDKSQHFSIINDSVESNYRLFNSGLSMQAVGLYLSMLWHSGTVSTAAMAEMFGTTEYRVRRAMNELIQAGLVNRERLASGYVIYSVGES